MGNTTRTVGGGSATGVANDWNSFLRETLTGQNQQQQNGADFNRLMQENPYFRQFNFQNPVTQATGQTGQQGSNAFRDAINRGLGGGSDPSGANSFINDLLSNSSNFQAPQFQNPFQAPQFQGPQLNSFTTGGWQGNGTANLSGFQTPGRENTMQGFGSRVTGDNTFLNQLMSRGNSMMQPGTAGVNLPGGVQLAAANNIDMNDPYVRATREMMGQQEADQLAQINAEAAASGASTMGTGTQFERALLRARTAPALTREISNFIQQRTAQDLAERSAAAQVQLGSRGQDTQLLGEGLRSNAQLNSSIFGNLSSLAGQARGQDINAGIAGREMDISQLGLGVQQRGQDITSQNNMMDAILRNQGLGNQFQLGTREVDNNAIGMGNRDQLSLSQLLNGFNQGNANSAAQFGLGTNELNSRNMIQMLGQRINAGQLGLQNNQLQNSNTNDILRMLFGAMGQSNQLGTPQAQVIQQPSQWGQLAQAGLTLGGAFLGGPGGAAIGSGIAGLFGNGGMPQAPQNMFGSWNPSAALFDYSALPQVGGSNRFAPNVNRAPAMPMLYAGG